MGSPRATGRDGGDHRIVPQNLHLARAAADARPQARIKGEVIALPCSSLHGLVEAVTTAEKIELAEIRSIGCLNVVEIVPQFDRAAGQRGPAWYRAEASPAVRRQRRGFERPVHQQIRSAYRRRR